MNKQLLSFSLLLVLVGSAFAQTERSKQLPSVAIGAGILSFNGDVGTGVDLSSFSRIRTGYNLTIEQRIGKYLGVSVNGLYGKLADSERSIERNLNFQSQIIQADLNLVIHFDNDLVFKRNSAFAPYIFGGFGYLMFDPYGDLKDKNNVAYNYWADGTIRDIAETDTNANASILLQRDYTYETQLKDSTTNYARSSFAIPVGLGFQLKISDNVAANIGASYYLAMTDWIDNYKNGANDRYIFANVSLQYNFGKPYDDSDPIYRSVDFSALDKLDTDEDGVKDGDDRCPGTPKGVKVDNRGCAEDLDEDGVPDYRDKEALTKKGALVDENGITQTDQMIMQRQAERDSLATERSNMFNENPSLSFLRDIESKNLEERKNNPNSAKASSIPFALRPADKNNDGYISTEEITMAIDSFFEGDSIFTVERLNDLIDFFFEQ
ncbi:MAG: outer membrane beta-barrel protein [Bacteroidetes bacterium]|nr:outer membrane beta-barrel protein [Bacteroidota bacterium]